MDNQQERVIRERDIAWMAGFLDGEGSFMIQISQEGKSRGIRYRPKVTVVNTHEPSIQWCARLFEQMGVGAHVNPVLRARLPQHRQTWHIQVNGHKRCLTLLNHVEEYLVTKRLQASVLREFIEWCLTLPMNWRSEADHDKAVEYAKRLSFLNIGTEIGKRNTILRGRMLNAQASDVMAQQAAKAP